MEKEMAKGFEEKTAKAGMDVNIRVVASSKSEFTAKQYIETVVNAFAQYNVYQYGNSLKQCSRVKSDDVIHNFIYRNFDEVHEHEKKKVKV